VSTLCNRQTDCSDSEELATIPIFEHVRLELIHLLDKVNKSPTGGVPSGPERIPLLLLDPFALSSRLKKCPTPRQSTENP
jgi:hypothetical protein